MAIPATRPVEPALRPLPLLRLPRFVVRLVSATAVALALLTGAHLGLERSGAQPGFLHLDKIQIWRQWQDRYVPLIRSHPETTVALLGDSIILGRALLGEKNVPSYLEASLKRIAPKRLPRIALFAWPGQSSYERYFLADQLVATGVRNIVFPFNLGSPSRLFLANTGTELSGWLPVRRWPEAAALPLAEVGLGVDSLLLYGTTRVLGGVGPWTALRRDQARMTVLTEALQAQLLTRPQERTSKMVQTIDQHHRHMSTRNYAAAFQGLDRDSPSIRMLEETLRIYRAAAIRVLLVVDPIDTQTLAEEGLASDAPGLKRTLVTLASVAQDHGVHFVDMHDLLGHDAFFDPMGHLAWTGENSGTQQFAEALAPHVARLVAKDPSPAGP